ncbi:MAG TPA: hypothetical protein VHZ03_00830 [Trebonia sp.]|nr:hypothetical protein [Trebonia sp.]
MSPLPPLAGVNERLRLGPAAPDLVAVGLDEAKRRGRIPARVRARY